MYFNFEMFNSVKITRNNKLCLKLMDKISKKKEFSHNVIQIKLHVSQYYEFVENKEISFLSQWMYRLIFLRRRQICLLFIVSIQDVEHILSPSRFDFDI